MWRSLSVPGLLSVLAALTGCVIPELGEGTLIDRVEAVRPTLATRADILETLGGPSEDPASLANSLGFVLMPSRPDLMVYWQSYPIVTELFEGETLGGVEIVVVHLDKGDEVRAIETGDGLWSDSAGGVICVPSGICLVDGEALLAADADDRAARTRPFDEARCTVIVFREASGTFAESTPGSRRGHDLSVAGTPIGRLVPGMVYRVESEPGEVRVALGLGRGRGYGLSEPCDAGEVMHVMVRYPAGSPRIARVEAAQWAEHESRMRLGLGLLPDPLANELPASPASPQRVARP